MTQPIDRNLLIIGGSFNPADTSGVIDLATAVSQIGSDQATLVIDGPITISTAITIPSNITFKITNRQSLITKSGSATLAINGPFEAGNWKVFSGFDATDITFGGGVVEHINPHWFGDITNGSGSSAAQITNNTTAIQLAINVASNSDIKVVRFNNGIYEFNNLYGHYDATLNDGYSQTAQRQGRIILRGSGRTTYASVAASIFQGTTLASSSSTGTASIHVTASGTTAQAFRIEDMNIDVNNTTLAVALESVPQNSGLSNVVIRQQGSGGGVVHKDVYNANYENVFINGAGSTVSLGDGFYLYNENTTGGFVNLDTVNVNAFTNSVILGHKSRTSAARLHGVFATALQGGEATVGVTLGGGLAASFLRIHAEQNTLGFKVINNAKYIHIRATTASNTNDCEIGSATADEDYYSNITIADSEFLSSAAGSHITVYTSLNTQYLTIRDTLFQGDGTNIAINLEDANHTGLVIINPRFANVLTEIANSGRAQSIVKSDSYEFSRNSDTEPNFTFGSRRSAVVSGAVIGGIHYRSNDTNLTDPGTVVAKVRAISNNTHSATQLGTELVFSATSGTAMTDVAKVTAMGVEPYVDDKFYLGKNDDDEPFAWKGVIMKDTTDGNYYRLEITSGVVTATDLTD